MRARAPHAVAIIGGGFTGASVAFHLARLLPKSALDIRVIEPRELLGAGLAYSTTDPAHRVNVPAQRMSLDPDDPAHFERWAAAKMIAKIDPAALLPDGRLFPLRRVFGHYVYDHMAPLIRNGWIRHIRDRVAKVTRLGTVFDLRLERGQHVFAETVIIATSHPPPQPPQTLLDAFAAHPRFIADPAKLSPLKEIGPDDRVLIIGTGLTMADCVASLKRAVHRGPITAVSRRGLLSRGHPARQLPSFGDFTAAPRRSLCELLRDIRMTIAEAEKQGLGWHQVFDALRSQGALVWQALPVEEQRRLVRHLRPYWDAHRFRVAPQVETLLHAARADGSLTVVAGGLAGARVEAEALSVDVRMRRSGAIRTIAADAVVVTTGPGHRSILQTIPFLRDLSAQGLLRLDRVGLGLDVDRQFRAIGKDGITSDALLIAGPLSRGTFGELMGLPEIAQHAASVARRIADAIAQPAAGQRRIAVAG